MAQKKMKAKMSHIRGRFVKAADRLAAAYTASIPVDWRLYKHDIAGSIAHAKMLARQGIISPGEAEIITGGLLSIGEEIERGEFEFKPEFDDIHMNIEARLMDKVGEVGGKLHTARSRNDQVAVDLRLFAREAIAGTLAGLGGAALDTGLAGLVVADAAARPDSPALAPGDDLETARDLMLDCGDNHIAVVADSQSMTFLGCLSERDLMAAYNRALVESRREERG